jgi:hypothetical protein
VPLSDGRLAWDIGLHSGNYAGAVIGSASWTYE